MTEPYYKQHWVDIDSDRHSAYDKILAFHPAMEPLLRPLELRAGLRVLDVGSGPGHTTFELARRVAPGGKVTGVDINAEFVERSARVRARRSWARSSCTVRFRRCHSRTDHSTACGAKMFLSMSIPQPILSRKWRA